MTTLTYIETETVASALGLAAHEWPDANVDELLALRSRLLADIGAPEPLLAEVGAAWDDAVTLDRIAHALADDPTTTAWSLARIVDDVRPTVTWLAAKGDACLTCGAPHTPDGFRSCGCPS